MGDLYGQCVKDVNHYIERADGRSQVARGLWDTDRNAHLIDCIERNGGWGVGYLRYVNAIEHAFRQVASCSQ